MSLFDAAKLILTPNGYKAGTAYSLKPFDGTGDFGVVRATTATYRDSLGVVSTALANVPRINYPIGGGCPHWLVESQATNLLLRSEEFDNASWVKIGSPTVTPNVIPSPDGNSTADLLESSSSGNYIRQTTSIILGNVYNTSFYIKNLDAIQTQILVRTSTTSLNLKVNWTGTTLSSLTLSLGTSSSFTDVGGGWFRVNATFTSLENSSFFRIYNNTTADSCYIWGAQLEEATTATSYIPTTSAAATRNADVITVTPPAGTTEIVETFSNGTTNTIVVIPATYQLPNGEIEKVVMT